MSRKKVMLGGTLVAGLITLLLLISCGQKSPTAPSLPPLQPSPVNLSINSNQSSDSTSFIGEYTIEYQDVGDLANLVEVPLLGDSISLILPPLSVPEVVTINVKVVQTLNRNGVLTTVLTFQPDGLVFLLPLELHYKSSDPDGTEINFYWFNENNKKWKLEQSGVVEKGTVVFYIWHFSKYKVVDGSTSNGSERY